MNKIQTASLKLNTLPVPTWRHLKMNECSLDVSYEAAPFFPSKDFLALEKEGALQRVPTLPGQDEGRRGKEEKREQRLTQFVEANRNSSYRMHVKDTRQEPLLMNYLFDKENPTLIDTLVVDMENKSSAKLIRIFRTKGEGMPVFHAGSLQVHVGEGANLTLLQVRFLDGDATDLNELFVTLGDNAKFTLLEIVIGSASSYIDTKVDMQGKGGECTIGCMNVVDGDGLADFNFHVEHKGEASVSSLLIRGALLDRAAKMFRGTIDFHKGCKGSKGLEDEYSLLLSPNVKNRSVPLILCGEEDVEGVHAVSSGRLDHNALFYLTSRGIEEKKAKRLLIEAQLHPILALISDEHVLSEIREQLSRRLDSHAQ